MTISTRGSNNDNKKSKPTDLSKLGKVIFEVILLDGDADFFAGDVEVHLL